MVDFLLTDTIHPENGHVYPAWNVQNIKEYPQYAPDQTIGSEALIHIIKTNQHSAGQIHTTAYSFLFSGRVKLLVDEKIAKSIPGVSGSKNTKLSLVEKIRNIEPYKNTTLLVNETSNLKINRSTAYIKLDMINSSLEKDTFSALEYGLSVIAELEKTHFTSLRKKRQSFSKAIHFN